MIHIDEIKKLREITKASYSDCKNALTKSDGDFEMAKNIIREKGYTIAEKSNDDLSQGIISSYIHSGERIGVLVEVKCSTDFVSRTPEFKQFVNEVALQIAAMKPKFISREDIPLEVISDETSFRINRLINDGAGNEEIEELLLAEMELWYSEVCLLEQTYIRDNKKRIQDLLAELVSKINEPCKICRFERWEIGLNENPKPEDKENEYVKPKSSSALLILIAIISLISYICGFSSR